MLRNRGGGALLNAGDLCSGWANVALRFSRRLLLLHCRAQSRLTRHLFATEPLIQASCARYIYLMGSSSSASLQAVSYQTSPSLSFGLDFMRCYHHSHDQMVRVSSNTCSTTWKFSGTVLQSFITRSTTTAPRTQVPVLLDIYWKLGKPSTGA